MALEQLTTAEGLTVYVDYIPTAQTAQVATMIDVGSVHEAPDEAGLAHALEHVTHLRTSQFSSKPELVRFRGLHAMRANAATGYQRTNYYASGPELGPMIHQMSEVVCRPIFETRLVAQEMEIIAEEARRRLDNIPMLHRVALTNVLSGEPYGRDPVGHGATIRYTAEQVRAFYDKYYGYGNMALLAVGNASPEEVLALAERHFTRMGEAAKPVAPPVERSPTKDIRSSYGTESSTVYLSKAVALPPGLRKAVLADSSVFTAALRTFSARLTDMLRNEKGVAYTAEVDINRNNHPNAWHLSATTSVAPENIRTAEDGLREVLSRSPEDYSDDEVRAAVGGLKGDVLSDMDTLAGRMELYDRTRQRHGVPLTLEAEARAVRALTPDGVRAAMGRLVEHFGSSVSITHLTGRLEAIGEVDHIVRQTDIA